MSPSFQYSSLAIIQLAAAMAALVTSVIMWRRRVIFPEARLLAFSLWAGAWWCAMGGMELCSTSLDAKILFSQFGYLGFFTPFWVWYFAYNYTTNGQRPSNFLTCSLVGFIILTFFVAVTNFQHHLLWREVSIYESDGLKYALYVRGPWFWSVVLVAYGMMTSACVMLLSHALNSAKEIRMQHWISVLAMFFPWLISAFYLFRIPVIGEVDNSPVGFVASGILLSWNAFRFGLFRIIPFSGQTLLERMPDPVFVIDRLGRLCVANPAAIARFAIRIDPFSNQLFESMVAEPHPEMSQALRRAKTEDQVPFSEGGTWWEILSSSLQDAKGRPQGRLHVLRNTTAMHQSLFLAGENERLAQKTSEAKSELIAQVSHDLRTPMHAILGSLDLLQEKQDPSAKTSELATIREASESLLKLINDLLDLSRIEAGKIELQSKPFLLGKVLDGVADLLRIMARKKNIELTCSLAPGLASGMRGDPDRLRQILINVVGNAVKFTAEGSVTIEAREDPGDPRLLRILVKDTGPGIREDLLPTLFRAFERGDPELARRHEGTGLGLSISKRLAEAMGGKIEVQSRWGEGTRLEILLPIIDPKAEAELQALQQQAIAENAIRPQHRTQKLKVLLADDEPLSQRVSAAMLRNCGCDVDLVDDGQAALSALEEKRYDAVVLDGVMPVLDGWETSRLITAASDSSQRVRLPVIAISADLTPEAFERWRKCGASIILPKPLPQKELRHALEGLFPV
jgi:signal transduction histidine kinase/CheY-like chemotaxis protein